MHIRASIKIIFICSSLERGKDGVGDYTRKLAGALIDRGHKASIIALNDRRMADRILEESQLEGTTSINVLRLSESLSWKQRLQIAKNFTDGFEPECMSLQYVPFGFQLKGLPFNLGQKLKTIAPKASWHIMFHELSVNKDASIKFRIWALLQLSIIRSLLKTLKPVVINTNTEIYLQRLQSMGYKVNILPLFSNITKTDIITMPDDSIIPNFLKNNRHNYIIGTLFGSFSFTSWNLQSLLRQLENGYQGKRFVIVSLGRMSFGDEHWKALQAKYTNITFLTLGLQDAFFVSYWLTSYTDFGILTTPPELASKSGSFMAYKEHGLPVVCEEERTDLKHFRVSIDPALTVISSQAEFKLPEKYKPVDVLDAVTKQFISDLQAKK